MNRRDPASLTSSLLARKGDATPADDSADDLEGFTPEAAPDIDLSAGGRPGNLEPPADNFLTRGPETLPPKISTERDRAERGRPDPGSERFKRPSRSRRLPLMVLAGLMVVVLAGGAWFAAKSFIGNSGKSARKKITLVAAPSPTAPSADNTSTAPKAPKAPPKVAAKKPPAPPPPGAPAIAATKLPPPAMAKPPKSVKAAPKPVKTAAPKPPAAAEPVKAAKKAAAKPAKKTAATGGSGTFGIQLSSVRSSSSAKKEMNRLSRKFAGVLEGTPLRVRKADLGKRGTAYRIQSTAVLSAAKAKLICARLRFQKQACILYGGR